MQRVLEAGEVVDAVERDGGLNPGVDVFEARLVPRVVGCQRSQRRQMAAGRAAGDRNEIRVAAVFGDVRWPGRVSVGGADDERVDALVVQDRFVHE